MIPIILDNSEQAETIGQALKIHIEREIELTEMIAEFHKATDTYPDCIQQLGGNVKSYNEFAYCVFMLGAFAGSEKTTFEMITKVSEQPN